MREFRLLGRPVDHSVSPEMHRTAFRLMRVVARYEAVDVSADELGGALSDTPPGGGGNVTLPYKEAAADLIDDPAPAVRATGACNCYWRTEAGGLAGDNTDVGGFLEACSELGASLPGAHVLVLGAGGAARAVLHALALAGAGAVSLWNRTRSRAERLAATMDGPLRVVDRPPAGPFDLVVNATRLGLAPDDPLPLDLGRSTARRALDLVYAAGGTAWVHHARAAGIPAADGLTMLVQQAALSLRHWFPGCEPPLAAMREAANAALTGRAER